MLNLGKISVCWATAIWNGTFLFEFRSSFQSLFQGQRQFSERNSVLEKLEPVISAARKIFHINFYFKRLHTLNGNAAIASINNLEL